MKQFDTTHFDTNLTFKSCLLLNFETRVDIARFMRNKATREPERLLKEIFDRLAFLTLSNVSCGVSRVRTNQQRNNGQRIWGFVNVNGQADELSSLHEDDPR